MCGITRLLTVPALFGSIVLVATGQAGFAWAAAFAAAVTMGGWAYARRKRGTFQCGIRQPRRADRVRALMARGAAAVRGRLPSARREPARPWTAPGRRA
jgi:hypothetical protein